MFEKKFMEMIYRKAQKPEDLLWHAEEPNPFLVAAMKQRSQPGRALDLGCGAGVFSVYMAKQKYDVTGLDFIPRALEMGRQRAEKEQVTVNFVEADLLEWKAPRPFDIVLDSGCLHVIGDVKKYKRQLLQWTAPGADVVVGHFGKRNFFDWRPVGPTRRTRASLEKLFAPEFELVKYEDTVQENIPMPVGPSVQLMSLWFKRIR
jgi:SAM-dependent methyltransferase